MDRKLVPSRNYPSINPSDKPSVTDQLLPYPTARHRTARAVPLQLYWKEARQLLPLIAMLAAIAFLLQGLLFLGRPGSAGPNLPVYFFLGLPGLFAAGVGALLVGHEKENRTLYWMASLPISARDIIQVKFLAGLVGLFAVWAISFMLVLFAGGLSNEFGPISVTQIDLPHGILYSFFLLVLGFATAWNFRSTFVGLLVLVGIACGYTLFTNLLSTYPPVHTLALLFASTLSLLAGWLGAHRALEASHASSLSKRVTQQSALVRHSIVDQCEPLTPWSALIWQFSNQNRAMLLGIVAMLFVAIAVFVFRAIDLSVSQGPSTWMNGLHQIPFTSIIVAILASSWLGVVAFQGDNLHQRIRFLADRGVAPKTVWLSRQIVPLTILGFFAIALSLTTAALNWKSGQVLSVPAVLMVITATGCIGTIYSVSQWMSQIVRSPIIAAILGPVVGLLPFAFGSYALEVIEAPIGLLAMVTVIPLVATYRMTQHWMDGKSGKAFWTEHATWLGLAVLIPSIPFLFVFATYPSMPANERLRFQNEIARLRRASLTDPVEITLLAPHSKETAESLGSMPENADAGGMSAGGMSAGGMSGGEPSSENIGASEGGDSIELELTQLPPTATLAEERALQGNHIEKQLSRLSNTAPISTSYWVVKRLMGDAMLARGQMQDEGRTEELLTQYRRNIRNIVRIVRGVRLVMDLKSQQVADQYEAWLVDEIKRDGARELFEEENWLAVTSHLSDKAERRKSRFQALCMDLSRSGTAHRGGTGHVLFLGKYQLFTSSSGTRLMSERRVTMAVWHLKKLLFASDDPEFEQWLREVAKDWPPFGSQFQQTATPFSANQGLAVPHALWNGEWEKQADALK